MAVQSLADNFRKYPQDKSSVFTAFKGMGYRHATFTEYLVEGLLKLDAKFLTPEPSLDDPICTPPSFAILSFQPLTDRFSLFS